MNKKSNLFGAFIFLIIVSLFSASVVSADTRYRVKKSDSLKRIVARHYVNTGLSRAQLMVAVFTRNPKAFSKGNINKLLRGHRLTLPSVNHLDLVSAAEAKRILRRGTKNYLTRKNNHRSAVKTDPITDKLLNEFNLSDSELALLSDQPQGKVIIETEVQFDSDVSFNAEDQIDSMPETDIPVQASIIPAPTPAPEPIVPAIQAPVEQTIVQALPVQAAPAPRKKHVSRARLNSIKDKRNLVKTRKKLSVAEKELETLEEERMRLRAQLDNLQTEKEKVDFKFSRLEEQLSEISKETAQAKIKTQKSVSKPLKPIVTDATALTKNTQKLATENAKLERELQLTRQELAEKTREKLTMSRQLDALKDPQSKSVAAEIGNAARSEKTLNSATVTNASDTGMGKLLWFIPVLAFFGALWFLLRRFLGTGSTAGVATTADGDTYATTAFNGNDNIDDDYQEASLETSIKLDVARAYLEADDRDSAFEMLQEVIAEGDEAQQQEAQEILTSYS